MKILNAVLTHSPPQPCVRSWVTKETLAYIALDSGNRVDDLRLLKRKHRPRGSHMQRHHICDGIMHSSYYCLPCRLEITLAQTVYGEAQSRWRR